MNVRLEAIGLILGAVLAPSVAAASETGAAWFTVSQAGDRVWRIDDHGADSVYLVAGTQKALLIDTGLGVGDLMKVVRRLTSLPVTVVVTHGHPDHAGGAAQFAEVYAHPTDHDAVRRFSSPEQRAANRPPEAVSVAKGELYLEAGGKAPVKLSPAEDGFVFDLGGDRRLTVVATPGHTAGSISLVASDLKVLFSGDGNNPLQWQFLRESTTLERWLRTLQSLDSRKDFEKVLPGHGEAFEKAFLLELMACARSILDGSCQDEPYRTFLGTVHLCRKGRAAIAFDPARLR